MEITAAVSKLDGGTFELRKLTLDEPREDEILVAIAAVGLCHTDVVAHHNGFEFDRDAVLGHEGAGVVMAVGAAVTKVKPGDRVAISYRSCGTCGNCSSGHPSYCFDVATLNFAGMRPDGSRAIHDGEVDLVSNFFGQSSFASHALTYERNVVRLDGDIPFHVAAPMGCGFQTGAGAVLNSFGARTGDAIVIAGGGAVGLSAVMAARIAGCSPIILIEPFAARRELALELGASDVIDPAALNGGLDEAVRAIIPDGAHYAFDTTGSKPVLDGLLLSLRPRGILGIVGISDPETPLPGDVNTVMSLGHRIIGILEGDSDPDEFLPRLIGYYREGLFPVDKLIQTYDFEDFNRGLTDQEAGKCVKIVYTFGGSKPADQE